MSTTKKLMGTTAVGGAELLAIEDVFSTYLYTGNGSTQTITNGIDLAGEGGMVWLKGRSNAFNHFLFDTERGATNSISSNTTATQTSSSNYLTAFNAGGFTVGDNIDLNGSGLTFASWSFRKAPRFFDVVTWTGDGVAGRTVSHNLGVEPGCIIVKKTNGAASWYVYHRGVDSVAPEDYVLLLNGTVAKTDLSAIWNDTAPTSTHFTLGANQNVNQSGGTYVAYLFAHDPLGPSGDGSDGLIACGSYTGNGSTDGPEIDLGWEPQWVIHKRVDASSAWYLQDILRGMPNGGNDTWVEPNLSNAETTAIDWIHPTSTGFKVTNTQSGINTSGGTYIYIAIRRGPMRQPTSGTEVFDVALGTATYTHTTGFPVDLAIQATRATTIIHRPYDRLRGGGLYLETSSTAPDGVGSASFDNNTGYTNFAATLNAVDWMFRRAPGFFDVVAYTGAGGSSTKNHNLTVPPELIIVKSRTTGNWFVYASALGNAKDIFINNANAARNNVVTWNQFTPDSVTFEVNAAAGINTVGNPYIAYLFATLPGVSKVGSYTGNGSSQTINCGFTSGARFVLIKRTDSTGDWYVWDTARGIVAANDPHLSLNTSAAEVTTDDSIDPDSSGFIVNQVAATNINVSSASYIYLAIA